MKPKDEYHHWEYQDYNLKSLTPAGDFGVLFYYDKHYDRDVETPMVERRPLDFLAVAEITTHFRRCRIDGDRLRDTEQDSPPVKSTGIVGIALYDTGFIVVEEFSNFAGYVRGHNWSLDSCTSLDRDQINALKATGKYEESEL